MKLIKLKFVQYQRTKKRKQFLIELNLREKKCQYDGNFIRRYLIKNTEGIKITKVQFFIKQLRQFSKYSIIDEYFPIEELEDSFRELSKKLYSLDLIVIRNSKSLYKSVAKIEASGVNYTITTKDIKFREANVQVVRDEVLTRITSPYLEIKVLILLKRSKGIFFNPIKRVNYIILKNSGNIIFDFLTNLTMTPFVGIKDALKNLEKVNNNSNHL